MPSSGGLFITANSSMNRFIFGVSACRNMMPDPEFFQQCMRDSFADSNQSLHEIAVANDPDSSSGKKGAGKQAA